MRSRNKKGFTVIELVIVIAVIGVLSSVLIPTLINLTAKANEASDQSLVKNLNTTLAIAEGEDGFKKSNNPTDMFDTLAKKGYLGETLIKDQKSDKTILYNLPKNRFLFEDNIDSSEFFGSKKEDFWVFALEPDTTGYSTYLFSEYSSSDPIVVTSGLDVGQNDELTQITYNPGENVDKDAIIRTNGGALVINAPLSSVKHYGELDVLNVEAVATSSYHEYGSVSFGQIKTGRVVIENEQANIDNLLLIAKDEYEFDDIILETKSGATLPELDRTDVTISENGTLVLNVITPNSNEYVYLTKAGVIEQVVVTNEKVDPSSSVEEAPSAKPANETSESTFMVAEQVANIGKKNNNGQYVDSNNVVIDVDALTIENVVIEEAKANNEDIAKGTTYFAGGAGTANNPYVISIVEHWNNVAADSKGDKLFALDGKYFVVVNDLSFGSNFQAIGNFYGHIDFRNHNITCTEDMSSTDWIDYANNDTTIENLNVYNYRNNFSIFYANKKNLSFKNVNVYGNHNVTGNNNGLFVAYPALYQEEDVYISLDNCDVYSTITATGLFSGVFFGTFNSYGATDDVAYLSMKDCTYYGTLISSSYAAMVISNPTSYGFTGAAPLKVYFDNVRNEGIIKGVEGAGLVMSAAGTAGRYEYVEQENVRGTVWFYSDGSYDDEYLIVDNNSERVKLNQDKTPSLVDAKNSGNGATTTAAYAKLIVDENRKLKFYNVISNKAVKYVVSFGFSGVWGRMHGGTFAYNIEIDAADINSAEIYAYQWVNADTYGDTKALPAPGLETHDVVYGDVTLKVDTDNHYVFSETDAVIRSQPRITVFAFDNEGKVINIGTEDGTVIIESNQPLFEVDLAWRSAMPLTKTVGDQWNSFYSGADGFAYSTSPISCSTDRQYTIEVSDSYNPSSYDDIPGFRLAVIFFNSESGNITEVVDYGYITNNKNLAAGQTLVVSPTSSDSDRFYIVGHCGNPNHHDANAQLHAVCAHRFEDNITLISELKD